MNRRHVVALALAAGLFSAPSMAAPVGDVAAGKEKAATCAACHGADGNSADPANPKLAGQNASYLVKQLTEFKEGKRVNATMQAMAGPLSKQDMADLSVYFASQKTSGGVAKRKLVERGAKIYRGGDQAQGITACMSCHGAKGNGNPAAKFPSLAGQHAAYTVAQLRNFKLNDRANDPNAMMRNVSMRLTDADMEAVATFIEGLY
jgi:cytochrome c553